MRKILSFILSFVLLLSLFGCTIPNFIPPNPAYEEYIAPALPISLDSIAQYCGEAYIEINENVPFFSDEDTSRSYEKYSRLDSLGRCGAAIACIGRDIMPTEERGDISSVKPTGWHTAKHNGTYLYHRCHILGFQLTGENANEKNLITGTAYFNVSGMLPFENMVADYVEETENHVLYRVTPIYDGYDLVARGVLMEAMSVEDFGRDLMFCVFVYNIQPGVTIDYSTGESRLANEEELNGTHKENTSYTYVLNITSKKFHYESCASAKKISESNKEIYTGTRGELIKSGYTPCGSCNP